MTTAVVAFGGNLGRPDVAFRRAVGALDATPGVRVKMLSHLYRSEPWGRRNQPPFLNGVAVLSTVLEAEELLGVLKERELAAGRERTVLWGARTLDLDLLAWGDRVTDRPNLTLPHPRLEERTFVLEPLRELLPHWRHPMSGRTAGEMLDQLVRSGRATACDRIPGARLGDSVEGEPCRS